MSLLEKIGLAFADRTRKKTASYADLVARASAGQVDEAEAVEILEAVDKTPGELADDVKLHQHRLELRATVDAVPDLDREAEKLKKQVKEANRIREKAIEKYDTTVHPLAWRLEQIAEAKQAANRARAELLKTSSSELLEQRRDLEGEIGAVSTESTAKKIAARDAGENIRKLGLTPPAQESFGKREAAERARQREAEQARLTELETEVAKLEEQRSELVARREALEAQQLMA